MEYVAKSMDPDLLGMQGSNLGFQRNDRLGSKTISGLGPGLAPRMNSKQASGLAFGSGHRGMDSALGSGRQVLSNLGGGVQVRMCLVTNLKST